MVTIFKSYNKKKYVDNYLKLKNKIIEQQEQDLKILKPINGLFVEITYLDNV